VPCSVAAVSDRVEAAGGVVVRDGKVLLVHRPRYDDWTLPKGKLVAGESELDGALREVCEETGHRAKPGQALGEVRYMKENSSGVARPKVVHYWAMEAVEGSFTPNREVDEVRWLTLDEAKQTLTRTSDREVLERFRASLGTG
jgi:8-oxo-dGTP pyrophosphatase MutT (NUDIX family)